MSESCKITCSAFIFSICRHSARRALFPMGSIGPLGALDGGGKGPSARTGGVAPRASGTEAAALVKLARTAELGDGEVSSYMDGLLFVCIAMKSQTKNRQE